MYNVPMDLANSYFLWLLAEDEKLAEYQKIIDSISDEYGTPRFNPHVTLVSGLSGSEVEMENDIVQLCLAHKPITLTFNEIDYTHGFFTALFLRAERTAEVNNFNQHARDLLKPLGQGEYDPHMSLCYGELNEEIKQKIITKLNFSKVTMTFDKLKLVRGHSDVHQWEEVNTWHLSE